MVHSTASRLVEDKASPSHHHERLDWSTEQHLPLGAIAILYLFSIALEDTVETMKQVEYRSDASVFIFIFLNELILIK